MQGYLLSLGVGLLIRRFCYKPEDREAGDYIGVSIITAVIYCVIYTITGGKFFK